MRAEESQKRCVPNSWNFYLNGGSLRTSTAFCSLLALLVTLLSGCFTSGHIESDSKSDYTRNELAQVPKEIDIPSIALKTRAQAEKILGKPKKFKKRHSKTDRADEAEYAWGSVAYMDGLLCFVNFKFHSVNQDYRVALAKLGLTTGPDPYVRPNDQNRIWQHIVFDNEFQCCGGLDFSYLLLPGDLSEAMIWILERDEPESWTPGQKQMWSNLTGRSLPAQAMVKDNVMTMPIESKHKLQPAK